MWTWLGDVLAPIVATLAAAIGAVGGPLIGFASAYLLFRLQESSKAKAAQQRVRRAVFAELRAVETTLSGIVQEFAKGTRDPEDGIREMQWYVQHARHHGGVIDVPPELKKAGLEVPMDEQIALWQAMPMRYQWNAIDIPLPLVDSVLASPSFGFSADEIEHLGDVRWQAHLLEYEVRNMEEWLRLTFTISDEANHSRATANLEGGRQSYRRRARYMLDAVRRALRQLGQ